MLLLSYTVSKGILIGIYFLFLIPIIVGFFSFLAIKKLKLTADSYFKTEDRRMEEFKKEQESEYDC